MEDVSDLFFHPHSNHSGFVTLAGIELSRWQWPWTNLGLLMVAFYEQNLVTFNCFSLKARMWLLCFKSTMEKCVQNHISNLISAHYY